MKKTLTIQRPVKRVKGNTRGRDFIVGDLHGCRHLLEARLAEVGFNRELDRLFSVGDLVDRGPMSFETLCLIEEPWFEFVIGNHEAMLLTYLRMRESFYHDQMDFIHNGGDWFTNLTGPQMLHFEKVLTPILMEAPLVLRVDDANCPYNILHAEGLGDYKSVLQDADLVNAEVVADFETSLTWGRRLVRGVAPAFEVPAEQGQLVIAEPAMEPNLSLTYVGHTILPNPVLHRSHLFLDCGGYLAEAGKGYLMLVEHKEVVNRLQTAGVKL
jgi:serine/threonine protein phosphatase 1